MPWYSDPALQVNRERSQRASGSNVWDMQFDGDYAHLLFTQPPIGEAWEWEGEDSVVVSCGVTRNADRSHMGVGTVTLSTSAEVRTEAGFIDRSILIQDVPHFAALTQGQKDFAYGVTHGVIESPIYIGVTPLQWKLIDEYKRGRENRDASVPVCTQTTTITAPTAALRVRGYESVEAPPFTFEFPESEESDWYFVRKPDKITVGGGIWTRGATWMGYRETQLPAYLWSERSAEA
jgi:hypothetical protein